MANGNGYIKLHRKMMGWGWYKDQDTLAVFIHLLLSANFAESEYMGMKILPGQVVTGRKAIAHALGISEQKVRTSLNRLKSTNEITIKSTNKFSVVTITNWALYQSSDEESTSKSTSKLTNNQPATNHIIRNKEEKEYIGGRRPKRKNPDLEDTYAIIEEWANEEK